MGWCCCPQKVCVTGSLDPYINEVPAWWISPLLIHYTTTSSLFAAISFLTDFTNHADKTRSTIFNWGTNSHFFHLSLLLPSTHLHIWEANKLMKVSDPLLCLCFILKLYLYIYNHLQIEDCDYLKAILKRTKESEDLFWYSKSFKWRQSANKHNPQSFIYQSAPSLSWCSFLSAVVNYWSVPLF